MSRLTPELLCELVAEARLAPSVHNIQPTRWRLLPDGRLALVDDATVRAPIADPSGHDVRVSHGAALEGMSLALNRRGLCFGELAVAEQPLSPAHSMLCTMTISDGATPDPLWQSVVRRMSWRGTFAASPDDDASLAELAASCHDAIGIYDRRTIAEIAGWADEAEFSFVRDDHYRHELISWMRLSPRHPRYLQDGLNREALAMSAFEATAAGSVLGSLFHVLALLGLASTLLSDRAKTSSAAAIILFTRPKGEDPLITGRHFYRTWLELDRAGFAACPISALADHPGFNQKLCSLGAVSEGRRLVNVFRAGRPSTPQAPRHFRLPVELLIV